MTEEILVFDTGPLSHIARQNWLGVLKAVVGERRAMIPDVVVRELRDGAARDDRIKPVLDATWIEHRELRTDAEIDWYSRFAEVLVVNNRNRGEAGVLALCKVHGGTAVIDDGAGRKTAKDFDVPLKPTLALLCEAIRSSLLTVALVSAFVDDLLASNYRLPIKEAGGFAKWAEENGMLGDHEGSTE